MTDQPLDIQPTSLVSSETETDAPSLSSLEWVMLVIVAATLAGACLLISARVGGESGQIPWRPSSALHIITDMMNLNFQYPTIRGVEIKWFVQGLGASAALAALSVGWFIRTRRDDLPEFDQVGVEHKPRSIPDEWLAMNLSTAAQTALVLMACWSMLSALWAPWPEVAVNEGARQMIFTLWAIALGRTLNRQSACRAAEILFYVLAVTALIGIWYYFERNPVQRLKFPIGNPIFFSACLLPGITLALAMGASQVTQLAKGEQPLKKVAKISGIILGLMLMVWAFILAESRGPAIGLLLGGIILFCMVIPFYWQRWAIAALSLGTLAIWKLHLWPLSWLESRPETVRFRLYAWKYAFGLFLSRPDVGRGQGSYTLLAQQMSIPDAERDATAFAGEVLGHAHNEWLQMLAELGAIGMGLFATAIGITLWAGLIAWRRKTPTANGWPKSRWYLLGLLGALLTLIVEAATDVGLRMPGLPVIFYTVLGLLWAISKEPSSAENTAAPRWLGRPIRLVGVSGGLLGACLILGVSTRDWLGALADPRIAERAQRRHWDEALNEASLAGQHRLSVEAYLSALYQSTRVARDAANYHLEQLRDMVARNRQPGKDLSRIRQLAKEDASNCDRFSAFCAHQGQNLLSKMPAYPYVAGYVADVYLYREEVASLMGMLGERLTTRNANSNLLQAREWLLLEYRRDRFDSENAIRLLQLMGDRPLAERLNMLRVPMRRGPIHPAVEQILAEMMREPDFKVVLNKWLAQATKTLEAKDAVWPDAYAPESLRLAAIGRKLRGEFEHAANLSDKAAILYERIRRNFRGAVFYARKEQAYYLLLAYPDQPQAAIKAAEAAIPEFSSYSKREDLIEARRQYSLYLLANDQEAEAREVIRSLGGSALGEESLERNIGYGLAELCQIFIRFRSEQRPKRFSIWMARSLELAPAWPAIRTVAARVALEDGQDVLAVEHLKALQDMTDDPKRFSSLMQSLVTEFPNRSELQRFASLYLNEPVPSTTPASTETDRE